MNIDIDQALARIGATDAHPALDGLEDRVMAAIAARPSRAAVTRTTAGAAAFALLLGMVSGALPAGTARAAPATLGAGGALAPSSLLLGTR